MPADSPAFVRSGKVRDLYLVDDERLLLVASDRLSAFDVVLPTPIPDKGRVLTGLTRFWLTHTRDLVDDHLLATDPASLPAGLMDAPGLDTEALRGRMMLCRRAQPLPAELVVRGHLAGGGWADYRRDGVVSGVRLPAGLREADRLPEPVFTPSTKAEAGHDEPIGFDALVALVGPHTAERARAVALAVYERGAAIAEGSGLIVADTKLEMGILPRDPADDAPDDDASRAERLILIDEVLTPDSSRFWDAASWDPGHAQPSFDKQYVRDWLIASGWDRTPPGPVLPDGVVAGTRSRYVDAFERITGCRFDDYLATDRIVTPAGASV
ncbi:MAG: phosphoribosylaminoimidazolesuccinocarboxamide synthase [Candidatus Limnocylindrales bacterium]